MIDKVIATALIIIALILVVITMISLTDNQIEVYTECDIIYLDQFALTMTFESSDKVIEFNSMEDACKELSTLTAACVNGDFETILSYKNE